MYHLVYKHKDDTIELKDSTIEVKDSTIEGLREEIVRLKDKLNEAEKNSTENVIKIYGKKICILKEEVGRLLKDEITNEQIIQEKQQTIRSLEIVLDEFIKDRKKLDDMLQAHELACPHCGAPLIDRQIYGGTEHYQGTELDFEIISTYFECGYSTEDGTELSSCGNKQN